MAIQSFPLPKRRESFLDTSISLFDCSPSTLEEHKLMYKKKASIEVMRIKRQFFLIEEEVLKTFQYIEPNYNNFKTNSVRFASIIRESCNLYEILSKQVYYELFEIDEDSNLNIFNYLSLDAIL